MQEARGTRSRTRLADPNSSEASAGTQRRASEMPSRRRNVRSVHQRRKMKLHNRRDDMPDCTTMESVEFSGFQPDPSLSDEDARSRATFERGREVGLGEVDPLETRCSLTAVNEGRDGSFFQSCYSSSYSGTRGGSRASHRRRRRHRGSSAVVKAVQELFENLGQAITEFLLYFCGLVKIGGNHPTPLGFLLLLCGVYFLISYIEVSFAGTVELLFEWLWPTFHVALRMIERFFKSIAHLISGFDDVAESAFCDMAAMWCDYFNLMCHARCSFTKLALERLRA